MPKEGENGASRNRTLRVELSTGLLITPNRDCIRELNSLDRLKKNASGLVYFRDLWRFLIQQPTKTMKHKIYLISGVCITALAFCVALSAQIMPRKSTSPSPTASPAGKAAPSTSPVKQSTRPIPFHGMVSAVDHSAKTFTIAGKEKSRVFKITDKTTVTKNGTAATMKDIAENEEVSGSYWKNADDSLEAKTVKIGPVKEKKSEESKKAKTSSSRSESPATSPASSPKP
jgi:hypothetical protein